MDAKIIEERKAHLSLADISFSRMAGLSALGVALVAMGCSKVDSHSTLTPLDTVPVARILNDKSLIGKHVTVNGNAQLLSVSTSPLLPWIPALILKHETVSYQLKDHRNLHESLPLITSQRLPEGPLSVKGVVISENGRTALRVTSKL